MIIVCFSCDGKHINLKNKMFSDIVANYILTDSSMESHILMFVNVKTVIFISKFAQTLGKDFVLLKINPIYIYSFYFSFQMHYLVTVYILDKQLKL